MSCRRSRSTRWKPPGSARRDPREKTGGLMAKLSQADVDQRMKKELRGWTLSG